MILNIGTDRPVQIPQTHIRLLLKSDQGLHCLPFCPHLLDTTPDSTIIFLNFHTSKVFRHPSLRIAKIIIFLAPDFLDILGIKPKIHKFLFPKHSVVFL